jgi:glycosyltransferase involved in cell wall biosynthesis
VHNDSRRALETIGHAMKMRRAIKRLKPEMIVTVGTYANLLVPWAARGTRARCVLTVHSNSTRLVRDSRFPKIIGTLMRWRYPRSGTVVAPSRGVIDDLRDAFGVRDTRLIPHGVNLCRIRELASEPVGALPTTKPYIVAVGRLTLAKDYPNLLRAFAQARGQGMMDADLMIVGDGEERANVERVIDELKLRDSVHLLGHRDNPFAVMRGARFFVLSSAWEGFGLSLLEAMALGLPVIATDCPSGPAEVLEGGQHGVVVPAGDSAALMDAMLKLSRSSELREDLSKRSLARAEQLSLRRMVEQYRDLFRVELSKAR